ncbi:MAG: S8 family serine peptidase [Gammaproteobacteria bacterium]|nr:S8 family serine peptidase [Gammaproteobacteria bacterium]MDH3431308.1 S8 family serine peptidase [Gammaproteobacteria bacterium]
MPNRLPLLLLLLIALLPMAHASEKSTDASRDILVTFDNSGARSLGGGAAAAYRYRKRYTISPQAHRDARAVAAEYSFVEVDHWPIKSLSVYCFVYRLPDDADRAVVLRQLGSDVRVESAQPLNEFGTEISKPAEYDDTYANLQHSLDLLNITAAHRYATGRGIRVAIIDSYADGDHEDLRGRVRKIEDFAEKRKKLNREHGTAVASVIGANANNARGMVGVAPEASMEVFVSCWEESGNHHAVCTSFTLAKALDALLDDPPHVLNMSLAGPADPLVQRLLLKASAARVVMVAASTANPDESNHFPASIDEVIGVETSMPAMEAPAAMPVSHELFAPGQQILVAVPENGYDFRSGSSLAAAHVSGVVALLLSVSPDLPFAKVQELLYQSQQAEYADTRSVNACIVLHIDDRSRSCD